MDIIKENSRMDEYYAHLILKGLTQTTIATHLKCLYVLSRECEAWDYDNISKFIIEKKKTHKNSTLNWYITVIRKYSVFCGVTDERLLKFRYFKPEETSTTTLSDSEIKAIYEMSTRVTTHYNVLQAHEDFLRR